METGNLPIPEYYTSDGTRLYLCTRKHGEGFRLTHYHTDIERTGFGYYVPTRDVLGVYTYEDKRALLGEQHVSTR